METQNRDSDSKYSKIDDYEVIEQLARRTTGTAFLVLHRTEKKYVQKKIPLVKQTEKSKRTAQQEVNLIAKLSHPYILEYKDAWVDKGSCICIIANYCEDGNMAEIIRKSRGAFFPEEVVKCNFNTYEASLCFPGSLKGDFGLGKLVDAEGLASSVVGTPNDMCPELFAGIPYGYKSDIWSLGCCMFEIAAHQPPFKAAVAELLRHQHLQPYLLLCHSTSSVFLPVKSPSSTKEKTRPSPGKSISPGDSSARQLKLKEKRTVLYFNESDNIQPRNLSDNYNTFKAKLETKTVDPTSYSHVKQSEEGDRKSCKTKELEVLSSPLDNEKAYIVECISGRSNYKARSFDEESTSSNSQPAKPRCYATETENGSECRELAIDCMSTESDGSLLHKDELEEKATTVYHTKRAKKDALRALDDKVSQLKSLAALAGKDDKDDWGNPTQQRAEALESLLEVCARLLKQEKIDELAGVLKPFGDDGMSSRETAIWLTKSLMTAQKLSKGS
ncbi:hypothetical protein RND71_004225 [Anisodus tanguticus]|uniref:Protein kinase domain-containing protein n=1 Tax=Anisodus tanguticus TaxID=243964 RepID=A0AAE1SXX5_9SOLA|nr:hypothetical protein RND71_004225 [Anisodus tanguticus]